MAYKNLSQEISVKSAADYSAVGSNYKFYKVNSSGNLTIATASTDAVLGVLQNQPVTNEGARVAPCASGGTSKVVLSATVTTGDMVGLAADGTGTASAAGGYDVGVAVVGAASGELATVQLQNLTLKA